MSLIGRLVWKGGSKEVLMEPALGRERRSQCKNLTRCIHVFSSLVRKGYTALVSVKVLCKILDGKILLTSRGEGDYALRIMTLLTV